MEGGIEAQAGDADDDADDTVADQSGRKSRAAKLRSATSTRSRPGSRRRACRTTCRPHPVSFLCRLPCSRLCRSEGASAVGNGSARMRCARMRCARMRCARMRCARGIGTGSITPSRRSPDALTKCPWLERTGSRWMPLAAMRLPRRRAIGSSRPGTMGPFGANVSISSRNSSREAGSGLRAARFSTRR
jgi:hypothetical protein